VTNMINACKQRTCMSNGSQPILHGTGREGVVSSQTLSIIVITVTEPLTSSRPEICTTTMCSIYDIVTRKKPSHLHSNLCYLMIVHLNAL
jgi:hypothetical protein